MADAGPAAVAPGPAFTPDPDSPGWGTLDMGDGSGPQTVPEAEAMAAGASVAAQPPPAGGGPSVNAGLPASSQQLPATILPGGMSPYGEPSPETPPPPGPRQPLVMNPDETGIGADVSHAPVAPAAPTPVGTGTTGAPGAAPEDTANPNAAILSPGGVTPGAAETETSHTVLSPEDRIAREQAAGDAHVAALKEEATGQREADVKKNQAQLDQTAQALRGNLDQQAAIQTMQNLHQMYVNGIQSNPIDEKQFWTTGRNIGATIALALSGFAHGISGGRDQTLNVVNGMLDNAVNRWLKEQMDARDSTLKQRAAAMQSNNAALSSLRMQAYGLIQKKIGYEADKAGLAALPPAGAGAATAAQQKTAEEVNKIGAEIDQKTKQKMQEQGPTTVADAKLVAMGLGTDAGKARQAFAKAMGTGQEEGNLGSKVSAADRLAVASATLEKIAQANGGTLPNQGLFSSDNLDFFRTMWARMGNKTSISAAQAQQELNQALLELRRSLPSSKLADSEAEGRQLSYTLNSGETSTTLAAIRQAAIDAQRSANDTAIRYAPGHGRDLVDFVRQEESYGSRSTVEGGAGSYFKPGRTSAAPVSTPATESDVLKASGAGGAAPESPLAQQRPASQPASAARNENDVKLPVLQAVHTQASAANLNGDAIGRIIRFESGGRADAKNPSGATGLIQWMPDVFKNMNKPAGYEGVRHSDLPDLTAEEQVPLVMEYFKNRGLGPNSDVGDYYLAVAAPGALGKPDSTVVYPKGSAAWTQNQAWRPADGGDITVGSIKARARAF